VIVGLIVHCKVPLSRLNTAIQIVLQNTLFKDFKDKITFNDARLALVTEGVLHDIDFLIQWGETREELVLIEDGAQSYKDKKHVEDWLPYLVEKASYVFGIFKLKSMEKLVHFC
jgi:hypothetical protein